MEKYKNGCNWYHGTNKKFSKWKINHQKDGDFKAQSALFFTTDKEYAQNSGRNLASFNWKKSGKRKLKCLDLLNASDEIYEDFRLHVLEKHPDIKTKFTPIETSKEWIKAWKKGTAFKLQPSESEKELWQHFYNWQVRESKPSWLYLQKETRDLIDIFINCAKELGDGDYNAMICKEMNGVNGANPKTSIILAILDLNLIEKAPDWLICQDEPILDLNLIEKAPDWLICQDEPMVACYHRYSSLH